MISAFLGQRTDFRTLVDQLAGVALWTFTEWDEFDHVSSGIEDIWEISVATSPLGFMSKYYFNR